MAVWFFWKTATTSIFLINCSISHAFHTDIPIGIGSSCSSRGEERKAITCLASVPPKNPKSFYNSGKSRREDEIGRKVS